MVMGTSSRVELTISVEGGGIVDRDEKGETR